MAQLTEDEWREVRAEWEADPRPGLEWLTLAGGGRWDITQEPMRRRRNREGWEKAGEAHGLTARERMSALRVVARQGDPRGADPNALRVSAKPVSPAPADEPLVEPSVEAEALPVTVARAAIYIDERRQQVRERQKLEWNHGRKLLYRAMALAGTKEGQGLMRDAVGAMQALTLLQNGESKAWGLDADFINYSALSEDELRQLVKAG